MSEDCRHESSGLHRKRLRKALLAVLRTVLGVGQEIDAQNFPNARPPNRSSSRHTPLDRQQKPSGHKLQSHCRLLSVTNFEERSDNYHPPNWAKKGTIEEHYSYSTLYVISESSDKKVWPSEIPRLSIGPYKYHPNKNQGRDHRNS